MAPLSVYHPTCITGDRKDYGPPAVSPQATMAPDTLFGVLSQWGSWRRDSLRLHLWAMYCLIIPDSGSTLPCCFINILTTLCGVLHYFEDFYSTYAVTTNCFSTSLEHLLGHPLPSRVYKSLAESAASPLSNMNNTINGTDLSGIAILTNAQPFHSSDESSMSPSVTHGALLLERFLEKRLIVLLTLAKWFISSLPSLASTLCYWLLTQTELTWAD